MSIKIKFKSTSYHVRNRIIGGLLLLFPFFATFLLISFVFSKVWKILYPTVEKIVSFLLPSGQNNLVENIVTGIVFVDTLLILVLLLYFVGTIGQIVAGKRLLAFSEKLLVKIPLVGLIYSATKQVITAISLPGKKAFKSVVLVQFPRSGMYCLGFFTGFIRFQDGSTFCKVFIPTAPNPTTGFFEMIPMMEVKQANISVEEAFKMIISGGLVSPENIATTNMEIIAQTGNVKDAQLDTR